MPERAFLVLARKWYSELTQEGIREFFNLPIETIAKPRFAQKCHSEQSEESRIFMDLRSFTSFRMTVK